MSDLVGNCEDRFSHNEAHIVYFQYIFDIQEEEEEIMCSLEQADKRVDKSKDNYTIGFTIMKV